MAKEYIIGVMDPSSGEMEASIFIGPFPKGEMAAELAYFAVSHADAIIDGWTLFVEEWNPEWVEGQ